MYRRKDERRPPLQQVRRESAWGLPGTGDTQRTSQEEGRLSGTG